MLLSDRQKESFAERGLVRVEHLLPEEVLVPVRERAFAALEQVGVWSNGRWIGEPATSWSARNQLAKAVKKRTKNAADCNDLQTPELMEAVTELVNGRAVGTLTPAPQVLFTPPGETEWSVPHTIWHLDAPRLGEAGLPGVQMFAFLHPVAPRGGGTLLVAGSHQLLNDDGFIRSKDVKRRLKREVPYFRELLTPGLGDRLRFLEKPTRFGNVELRVVELCGNAGDVYLTDLRLLHTLAPNASTVPRLMATQRFGLESLLDELAEPA